MRRLGQMPGQQPVHRVPAHSAALLGNDVVHSPFDLEKDGRLRSVVVKTKSQLVAVFVPVDRAVVKAQAIRVQVQAVNRVREIRERSAIFINLQIAADKIPHSQSDVFLDDVLQLETLLLHFVFGHTKINRRSISRPGAASSSRNRHRLVKYRGRRAVEHFAFWWGERPREPARQEPRSTKLFRLVSLIGRVLSTRPHFCSINFSIAKLLIFAQFSSGFPDNQCAWSHWRPSTRLTGECPRTGWKGVTVGRARPSS